MSTSQPTEQGWSVNGAPGLYHNGKPVPAMMFWQWEPQEKNTRDMSAAGMDIFAMFGSFPHYKHPYWRKDGSFGMKYQEGFIDKLLSWERVKRLTGGEAYETLKMKSADELRAIYKAAGVHVYTDSDEVLSANSAWLMLHTRKVGDYKIELPHKVRNVTEITTEKTVAENVDSFTWHLPKHATAVFLLEAR